ncbi:hypothetical protein PLICRDRAFT_107993 [Plicaturopsis crispa FD-325 SS-3]|nr:hypothetical protein PLICRDRAFT_107993 [Plicaturopsis crispa FD-325 SS-3]
MSSKHASGDLILATNAGSSSLKISLYQLSSKSKDSNNEPVTLLLTSSISNISSPPAKFSFIAASPALTFKPVKNEEISSIDTHEAAFTHFLQRLQHDTSIETAQIRHVCHRVVHGGDYHDPVVVSDKSDHLRHIERLSDLAPLHNGPALRVIQVCNSIMPHATSIAFFDTAFHRSIPPHIASYAIDPSVANRKGLKKYGFHGLSYQFILRSVAQYLQKPEKALSLILLHLGSGASACAIRDGQSYDTSMGLTPLSGLPGATRAGAIDPSLIFHYTNKAGRISHDPALSREIHVTEAEDILNTKSGWSSLTGTTDFGLITSRANFAAPTEEANAERHAFELFADRVMNYIGSYYLKLGGQVDALVFAAGLGEKGEQLREFIGNKVRCLGFSEVDREKNHTATGTVVDIGVEGPTSEGATRRILVCQTDEQLEMARQCALEDKFWSSK